MKRSGRTLALLLIATVIATLLVVVAHGSVLAAPFRGDDHAALSIAAEAPWMHGTPTGLGAGAQASLWLSRQVWEDVGPLGWRLEAIFWLALTAVGWSAFTRRLLLPWTGSDHAQNAGRVSGLLVLVHPLAVAVVATLTARAELLGFCALAWSGASFLRGRQDRRAGLTALAFVLAFLGALASRTLVLLPLILIVAEIVSAHRYRRWRGRLRTAFTTGAVFGGAVALGCFLAHAGDPQGQPPWGSLGEDFASADLLVRAKVAAGELGTLVLPASPRGLGAFGLVLAGALFLIAIQPAVAAARSAPRLWGWLLFGWFGALFVSVFALPHAPLAVTTFDLGWGLFASVGVLAFGLGLSVTAIKGLTRTIFSAVLVIGYASLALGNSQAYGPAGVATQELIVAVADAHEEGLSVWVLDPPTSVDGVRATGRTLDWLGPRLGIAPGSVRGLASDALGLALATDAGRAARAGGLVLLAPDESAEHAWRRLRTTPTSPGSALRSWRSELRSPDLDLDTLDVECVLVRALSEEGTDELGPLGWSARAGLEASGVAVGSWWRDAGDLRGVIDLSSDATWQLAGHVRRVFFESGRGRILEATLEASLPEALSSPGGSHTGPLAADLPGDVERVLVVLAPNFELVRLDEGTDLARELEPHFRSARSTAWLELRRAGHVVARSRAAWPSSERTP